MFGVYFECLKPTEIFRRVEKLPGIRKSSERICLKLICAEVFIVSLIVVLLYNDVVIVNGFAGMRLYYVLIVYLFVLICLRISHLDPIARIYSVILLYKMIFK